MNEHIINQFGDKPIYVERNIGSIYVGNYVANSSEAFADQSFELQNYAPKIDPPIQRDEVKYILDWIAEDTFAEKPNRVALLYGSAGVGKSVVMHEVLLKIQQKADYLVLGLKIDQIEFVDSECLRECMHLAKPIVSVIRDMAKEKKRVVLLIDQIDALSLFLSSNRTPLRSILKLIEQVRLVPHVRIVLSCRPYDLEYDPVLNDLKIPVKWEIKTLDADKVKNILSVYGQETDIGKHLIDFLGNPLYLYLYLKVIPYGKLRYPITAEVLYNELWRIYITDIDENKITRKSLLDFLDVMTNAMYERQELSIHQREIESNYITEMRYMLSVGLLLQTSNGRIQFFHQTMFDYVYARRFVEKGCNLLEKLSSQHQGLFSRAAVKSILTFLRETNPTLYIRYIDSLLYDKKDDGSDKFRFHLKSLALSNMTFFDRPKDEELLLIKRKIYNDSLYMGVIFESVHTGIWLSAIWNIIEDKGGWPTLTKEYKEYVMTMCNRTLWSDADKILDISFKILSYGDEGDGSLVASLVDRYQYIDCDAKRLITLYEKLGLRDNTPGGISLLKSIVLKFPEFVCDVLKEKIKKQIEQKEKPSFQTVTLDHKEEDILENMEANHHDIAIRLYVDLLEIIYNAIGFNIPNSEISYSLEFSHFQRVSDGCLYRDFTKDVTNRLIDDFLKNIDTVETQAYLAKFSRSTHEGFVFVSLYVYTQRPEKFFNEVYSIITQRHVLADAPCWVEYQALEALKTSFQYMSTEQQENIVHLAETLTDKGENHIFDKDTIKRRMSCSSPFPILDIDIHRGRVLRALPIDFLIHHNWNAYQERLRIERKFVYNKNGVISYPRLENEQPYRSSTMCGWTSVGAKKAEKMSCKSWYKSMTKYTDNRHDTDWNRPSLMGQCQLFRSEICKNTDKYLDFLKDIVTDSSISFAYVEAGMNGLLDAKKYQDAEYIFSCIVKEIEEDVNSSHRDFDIHSFLFAIDAFIKGGYLPKVVFDFLCNAVVNVEESETVNEPIEQRDIYNTAINQKRGHAARLLVECSEFEEYKDAIFTTLERIATTASVYTRSAILLDMAILNRLDKERNVKLFKLLMHDYDVRLMSMPIHNYNPLVYFINYAVDDLTEFFAHATEKFKCYREQVIVLWLAWTHNNHREDIKYFLDKMCKSNCQEARLSLVEFLSHQDKDLDEDAVTYITSFMTDQYDSLELGEQCDMMFHYAKSWSDNHKHLIAKVYVESPLCVYENKGFIKFLAGYATIEPVKTLFWLEQILSKKQPKDFGMWNLVTDVLIQSYNGIQSFNDKEYQGVLEKAMDMMDQLMMSKDNRFLITQFINKIDEE